MAEPRSEATQIFGARMREIRKEIGISQMDLGELAGIHFTNIAKIERGEANPSLFTIIRISDALEIDPAVLITGLNTAQIPEIESNLSAREFIAMRKKRVVNQAED